MIKFLADENIPIKAVKYLKQKGFNIISVSEIKPGLSDKEVIKLANKQNRIIITFDLDFGKLIFKEKLKVKGVILLRFTPKSPQQVAEKIEHLLQAEIPLENFLLIIKDRSIRILPLTRIK